MPVDNAPGHVENLWTFCGLFSHPQPDGDFSRVDAQFPQSGAPSARQPALNESAFCGSVSSEGRTAPTDTTLVAHITPLGTNGAAPSMPVSKTTRYEVLRRDNHTCRYCGASAPDAKLTIDHVTPVALGGSDNPDNLVTACQDCNYGKGKTPPGAPLVEDVEQDAFRWAQAIARAAALAETEAAERYRLNGELQDLWSEIGRGYGNNEWWRPSDWAENLDMFRKRGLPQGEILDAFWIMAGKPSMQSNQRWRYFCGICWRKLDRLQEVAKSLLETEAPDGT